MSFHGQMTLADICDLIVDCPHSTAKDEGAGYPLIRTPNIRPGYLNLRNVHRVSKEVYEKRNIRATPKPGDIILAREAPAGNAGIILEGQQVCLGQRTVLIRPNEKYVDPWFLNYYLNAPQQRQSLLNAANGATVAHVNMSAIRSLPVNLPNFEKQSRIARVLRDFDSLIRLNEIENDYLAEMCETLATAVEANGEDMLADISIQVAEKVACSESSLESYVSTESLLPDKGGRQEASSLPATGKVTIYKTGDTLVSNIRPYFKKIWFADQDGTCSGDVIVFRAKDPSRAAYLYSVLRSNSFFEHVMAGAKGTKMPRGDKKQMMQYPIPPEPSQDTLDVLTAMVRQVSANNRENKRLSGLRDALLPKLMSGEIDTSTVEIPTQPKQ